MRDTKKIKKKTDETKETLGNVCTAFGNKSSGT